MTIASPPVLPGRQEAREQIDAALAQFLVGKASSWVEPQPRRVFEALYRFLLRPGKRVRPLFCLWGWYGAGGDLEPSIVRAASALEIFHGFCIIHDDVMDASQLRRRSPTLHRQLAEVHTALEGHGDAQKFGTDMAILCGDICAMWADELFHTSGLGQQLVGRAYPLLAQMRTEVCLGQMLEMRAQATGATMASALEVITYKTAMYTVQRPLQIGGTLATASPQLLSVYEQIGGPLGLAFQLRDDVLGVFGDPQITGKSNLDDLREGKPTVLMVLAREHADACQRREIEELHGSPQLTLGDAETLRQIIRDSGALTTVENMIGDYARSAQAAIEQAPIPPDVRHGLSELAEHVTGRTS